MERIYIEGDLAQFTRRDLTLVDMQLGEKGIESLEPRRLFPLSDKDRYIALLDADGAEQAVIRDLNTLPPEQRLILEACLQEYYLIPKILKILDYAERFDGLTLYTETDRGPVNIEIRVLMQGFKMMPGGRALIRDMTDNRYEIPDVRKLDKHSRLILARYL